MPLPSLFRNISDLKDRALEKVDPGRKQERDAYRDQLLGGKVMAHRRSMAWHTHTHANNCLSPNNSSPPPNTTPRTQLPDTSN